MDIDHFIIARSGRYPWTPTEIHVADSSAVNKKCGHRIKFRPCTKSFATTSCLLLVVVGGSWMEPCSEEEGYPQAIGQDFTVYFLELTVQVKTATVHQRAGIVVLCGNHVHQPCKAYLDRIPESLWSRTSRKQTVHGMCSPSTSARSSVPLLNA